jgi:hypothetical protein
LSAVPRTLASIGLKTVGGIHDFGAATLTGLSNIKEAMTGSGDKGLELADMLDNPFRKGLDDMEQSVKDAIPIYKSSAYTDGNFLSKMKTAEF